MKLQDIEKSIEGWLFNQTKPVVVILGPTASGKTNLSLELAKKFQGEIINADSRQIYENMDIGTNKISHGEMQSIPHHLLSFKRPDEIFTVAEYQKQALEKIDSLHQEKKLPFLVGGTGLYISAVVEQYSIPKVLPNYEVREYLEDILEKKGELALYKMLKDKDPAEAKKLHQNQTRYIIRALEIALSGEKKSELATKEISPYDFLIISCDLERDILYQRINQRTLDMIASGFIQEVENLKKQGYDEKTHAMNGIGYQEILRYLKQEIDQQTAVERIQKRTRNYAKRQITWFRRFKNTLSYKGE